MPEYLSLAEARLQPDVDLPSLLAVAKRRPDKLPLFLLPSGAGWAATFVSRLVTSEPHEPQLWSYATTEVWLRSPVRVRPELLQGPGGELLMQRFRIDGRHPDHGGDVREYHEFKEPRRFDATDLLIRRRDLERWKVLNAAAASCDQEVDRLRAVIRVALEQTGRTLSSNEARELLGVSLNTLYDWRRRAEELRLPVVSRAINPQAKRKQYRWLADGQALRDWATLLELVGGDGAAPEPRSPRRRAARRSPSLRKGGVARELDELLGRGIKS